MAGGREEPTTVSRKQNKVVFDYMRFSSRSDIRHLLAQGIPQVNWISAVSSGSKRGRIVRISASRIWYAKVRSQPKTPELSRRCLT